MAMHLLWDPSMAPSIVVPLRPQSKMKQGVMLFLDTTRGNCQCMLRGQTPAMHECVRPVPFVGWCQVSPGGCKGQLPMRQHRWLNKVATDPIIDNLRKTT